MCINPVNWKTDATPAILHDTITVTLSPEHNVLVLSGYSGSEYTPILGIINTGDFHGAEPMATRAVVYPVFPNPTRPIFLSRNSINGVSQKQKSLLLVQRPLWTSSD